MAVIGRHTETQAAQPPPAAKKHPVAPSTAKGPNAVPSGRPMSFNFIKI